MNSFLNFAPQQIDAHKAHLVINSQNIWKIFVLSEFYGISELKDGLQNAVKTRFSFNPLLGNTFLKIAWQKIVADYGHAN